MNAVQEFRSGYSRNRYILFSVASGEGLQSQISPLRSDQDTGID
jgi:hypothetical protein